MRNKLFRQVPFFERKPVHGWEGRLIDEEDDVMFGRYSEVEDSIVTREGNWFDVQFFKYWFEEINLSEVVKPLLEDLAKETVAVTLNCSEIVDEEIETNFLDLDEYNAANIQSVLKNLNDETI